MSRTRHISAGIALLQQQCPALGAHVGVSDRFRLTPAPVSTQGYFAALVQAVVGQQISTSAAGRIHGRLVAHLDGEVTPGRLLACTPAELRAAGLSAAKVRTLRELADAEEQGHLSLITLATATDEEVIAALTRVWGIGRWTAEMFLMFTMGRLDVWPVGDLAVRRGWAIAHGLPTVPSAAELEPEGEAFRPYRSVAAWYCWRVREPVEQW